jgi:Tol biopolymer transport system component
LPEGNWGAIYLIPSGGGDPRPISSPGDSIDVGAIAFSPDGKRIAFFSEGAIKTMPVQGGTVEILVRDIQNGRHSEMEFSPTGGRIAFTTGRPYVGDTKIRVGQP